MVGSSTTWAKAAVIKASAAVPPRSSAHSAASVATGWEEETIPRRPMAEMCPAIGVNGLRSLAAMADQRPPVASLGRAAILPMPATVPAAAMPLRKFRRSMMSLRFP